MSARRLALVVLGAVVVGAIVHQAFWFVLATRQDGAGPGVGLEIGLVGNLVYVLLFPVVPVLAVVAGVLAIRRRRATMVEIVLLCVVSGLFGLMGVLAAFESLLGPVVMFAQFGGPQTVVWSTAPVLGVAVVLAVPVLLVVVIVQTIRAPRAVGSQPDG